jgi:DnaK suppressor protein
MASTKKTAKKGAPKAKPVAKKTSSASSKKSAPAKKSAAAKSSPKKSAPAAKAAAKKSAAVKKPAAKKTTAAKKPAAKKAPAAKKPAAKKTASAGKAAAKKPAARKSSAAKKLTKAELKKFEALLWELRDRITEEMNFLSGSNVRNNGGSGDLDIERAGGDAGDQGAVNFDREFALNLMSSESDVIYEIDQALQRIQDGTYGICEMSGKQIERERLKVIPYARYSVAAKTQLEEQQSGRRMRMR